MCSAMDGALTAIFARSRSSWSTRLGLGDNAKVVGHATLAPNVTANVQWAGVEGGQVCSSGWLGCAIHLVSLVLILRRRQLGMKSYRWSTHSVLEKRGCQLWWSHLDVMAE
jgi:hypothetical protein